MGANARQSDSSQQPAEQVRTERHASIQMLEAHSTDCDGKLVTPYSTCCPAAPASLDCAQLTNYASTSCRSNPKNGTLCKFSQKQADLNHFRAGMNCPESHPFACKGGSQCPYNTWRPTTGSEADCNGLAIERDTACCPDSSSVPCRASSDYSCRSNVAFGIRTGIITRAYLF